jgi:hypothetical protein
VRAERFDALTVNGSNADASKTINLDTAATVAVLTIDGTTGIIHLGRRSGVGLLDALHERHGEHYGERGA